jgi:hypothetical protein
MEPGLRKRGKIMTIEKGGRVRKTGMLATAITVLLILAVGVVSCGGTNKSTSGKSNSVPKLPQGMTEKELKEAKSAKDLQSSGVMSDSSAAQQSAAQSPSTSADLAGARFTMVSALRNDSNKKVLVSGQREVLGDYMEVELTVENIGDDLVGLSQYSFRLKSPGIEADTYNDYYGSVSPFGTYVSEHTITAVLLDYADLKPVDYKLRIKEKLESVFLFFDLNPLNTTMNEGVTKDNTRLIIRKVTGSGSGDEVEISLAGYPD